MGDGQEQDQHEERLKEVFNSFDTSGSGALCLDELSELCQSLHLGDSTPALLHTLLQNQDHLTARVRLFVFGSEKLLFCLTDPTCSATVEFRKAIFAFLPSLINMGDVFYGLICVRSSKSFEFGRCLF